jgi:hypothetical protein
MMANPQRFTEQTRAKGLRVERCGGTVPPQTVCRKTNPRGGAGPEAIGVTAQGPTECTVDSPCRTDCPAIGCRRSSALCRTCPGPSYSAPCSR